MQMRWWLLGAGALLTIVLVVWSINEVSADPLRGIETVAIEPVEDVPEFVQEGVLGQLSVKFKDRGIRIDAANPDAVIHIDVSKLELNESGFYLVASLEIKKKTGEQRKMVFTLSIDKNGINAELKKKS
ncbi:hypothetical protein LM602_00015 [Candidatus Acetothermia bacterium]|jgi:hypothetical protein|nr:hypothetical protein [Candidatus Acetothermia bacterium]MCI2430932.1 hypothetical protein [Candidatus Acetothermia bacterium]MCI2437046.1 hypothetical protein [Candidatus Acetothermia bacterium]